MRLIDADKLNIYDVSPAYGTCVMGITEEDIELAPTVEAEPVRHGRYIGTEFDGYADGNPVYYEWKCSECGCVFEEEEPTYNYCPNCGAKLDDEHGKPCDDCQEFDCYGCKYAEREEE